MTSYRDPKLLIALILIAGFFYSFAQHPDDSQRQALIIGFATAYGYFLGSSSNAASSREQVGKALDIAAANQPVAAPDIILKPGEIAQAEGDKP